MASRTAAQNITHHYLWRHRKGQKADLRLNLRHVREAS